MRFDRRTILGKGVMGAASTLMESEAAAAPLTSASRPAKVSPPSRFSADWASLTAGFSAPDWFRTAKFGIWAHWGTASVPAAGDD